MPQIQSERFREAVKVVLDHEGSQKAKDGSRFGIGYNTAEMFKIPNPEKFIDSLTWETAAGFYHQHYWNSLYERIRSRDIATKVFDLGVVQGVRTAVRLLQAACNEHGAQLVMDGRFGPKTLAAVNAMDPEKLLATFAAKAVQRMKEIIAANPANEIYRNGWIKRARWPLGDDESTTIGGAVSA